MIAIDTETYLIKGNNVPPLVCLSYCRFDGSNYKAGVLTGPRIAEFIERIAKMEDEPIILHNASFDWTVLMRAFPKLMPTLFSLMERDRVHCTMIREKLHKIRAGGTGAGTLETASGGRVRRLSLAGLAHKYLGFDMLAQKAEGSVRYRYDELAQKPATEWPQEAIDYAGLDALVTVLVYQAQEQDFDDIDLRDQHRQVRADFALQIMSTEGIQVDSASISQVEANLDALLEDFGDKLVARGILDQDRKANTALIKDLVERSHIEHGLDVPKTASAEVSTAKDALKASEHPDLLLYLEFKKAQKLRQTYIPSLQSASHFDGRLRTRYDSLVQTGRTSSASPNLQNLPRKGGLRDCFVASEGHTLVLCDYDAAEMRTLAQSVLDLAEHETPLLKMYQAHTDYDPHAYFGAKLLGIEYEEMLERVANGDSEALEIRQRAKPANFGYAGGMGASAFVAYAQGYGVEITTEEAQSLRDAWIQTYDMRPWFREAEKAQARGYVDVPRSGRRRGRVGYTQSCNTPFQGLASDGAKDALFRVAHECYAVPSSPLYGSRPLVFIHDEIIVEAPDARAAEAGDRLAFLMCDAMNKVCPDVPAQATPALCKRWLKGAKSIRDEQGRLLVWSPS